MRLETRPRILFQQFLAQPQLGRAGIVHSLLPSCPVVDRRDARIAFHAHVPDARRTVGLARRAAEHASPEHVALNVLESRLHVAFIAVLANQDGHDRRSGVGGLQFWEWPLVQPPNRRARSGACRNR